MSTSELSTLNSVEKMNFLSRIQLAQKQLSKPVHMTHYRHAHFNFPWIRESNLKWLVYMNTSVYTVNV